MRFLFIAAILVGCGSTNPHNRLHSKEPRGFCFKAEGLSKMRCYKFAEDCYSHSSLLSDHHPWAKIQIECKQY